MSWRVALIDSCGRWPGALDSASFTSASGRIECGPPGADPTGQGSLIAQLLSSGGQPPELLLAQVFRSATPTSAAAVAAAIDWAVLRGANLVHLSLGLGDDRAILKSSISRALAAKILVVASTPARGKPVYPASYEGVVRATGDARCAPGEIACLGTRFFGGCSSIAAEHGSNDREGAPRALRGASAGAAWVSKALTLLVADHDAALAALTANARFVGAERRGMECRI